MTSRVFATSSPTPSRTSTVAIESTRVMTTAVRAGSTVRASATIPIPGQRPRGVDEHIRDVGLADSQDVLGHLQRQAHPGSSARGLPPRPRRCDEAEVEPEGDEDREVGEDLEGRIGAGPGTGHERDELDLAFVSRAEVGDVELPHHEPGQQDEVGDEQRHHHP